MSVFCLQILKMSWSMFTLDERQLKAKIANFYKWLLTSLAQNRPTPKQQFCLKVNLKQPLAKFEIFGELSVTSNFSCFPSSLTLYLPGYFCTLFVLRGKYAPLSKNYLVSDRSKIFCMFQLFFVKFFNVKILRLWRHANNDYVIKTSKSL